MARNRSLTVAAGQSATIEMDGNYLACYAVIEPTPTTGSLTVEYRDSDDWRPFKAGKIQYPINQPISPSVSGHLINAVRVTNDSDSSVNIRLYLTPLPGSNFDERAYGGNTAINTQNFIESNIKNGSQWELSHNPADITAGQSAWIFIQTGAKPVLIKAVLPDFLGAELHFNWFRAPVVTGQSAITIYNPNDRDPLALLSSASFGGTVSNNGTQVSSTVRLLGDPAASIQQKTPTTTIRGFERVFRPNTLYGLRALNPTAETIKLRNYITFYEGDLSVDL
jgi:hypothetical protein